MFTLGNLYCGFLSIGFAAHGQYKNAAILILIGMMLDSMDGRLARMLNADSNLGKELDSLADIVTFGVAPVFFSILYLLFPLWTSWSGNCRIIPSVWRLSVCPIQHKSKKTIITLLRRCPYYCCRRNFSNSNIVWEYYPSYRYDCYIYRLMFFNGQQNTYSKS